MTGFPFAFPGLYAAFLLLSIVVSPPLPILAAAPAGKSDSDREAAFEAYRKGMPLDSLYFLLAGQALGRLSFDTAMAFNLSIPTPASGGFRDSVLSQRYRLYRLSGLHEDADRLKDSLPLLPEPPPPRRRGEWSVLFRSGQTGEDQGDARIYPSGQILPGVDTGGWVGRSQGMLSFPLPSPVSLPLSIALGYDLAKSYYKDSLDVRGRIELRADRILERFFASFAMEAGRIAELGPVTAYKGDLTWIGQGRGGHWIGYAGYESEWEGFRDKRYDVGWLSLLREWNFGSGWSMQGSLAASLLLLDPYRVAGVGKVIFVDDVSKAQPTHFTDASFQDSIPRGSVITRYRFYTEASDSLPPSHYSQDAITLRPGLGFSLPAFLGARVDIDLGYGLTFYPEAYAWKEIAGADLPPGTEQEFRGYALNRADGRYYRAILTNPSGGIREVYLPAPLRERRVFRRDHSMAGGVAMSRALSRWGEVRIDLGVERTLSNLSGRAPIWIPEWEYNASIRWFKAGRWL